MTTQVYVAVLFRGIVAVFFTFVNDLIGREGFGFSRWRFSKQGYFHA